MLRNHNNGELRLSNVGEKVTLEGNSTYEEN